MSEETRSPRPPFRPNKESQAQSRRIDWARSLTNEQMEAVLQDALLTARSKLPRVHEVVLLEEVVHELKSRLKRYHDVMGPPPPPKRYRYDDDEGDDDED